MYQDAGGNLIAPRERSAFLPEAVALRRAAAGQSIESTPRLNWDRFSRLGVYHRLLPLVDAAALGGGLPGKTRRALAAARLLSLRRERRVLKTARMAISALEGAGIPCVLMGGPAMFSRFYAPGTRYSTDVDVLVSPRTLAWARRALLRAGARRWQRPFANLFVRDGITIDLHSEPTEAGRIFAVRFAFHLPAEDVLARRRFVSLPGPVRAPIPDAADEALITAAHFHKHCFGRWLWGLDLVRILAAFRGEAALRALAGRIATHRFGRVFSDAAVVIGALFGTRLHPILTNALPPGRSRVRRWALSRALDGHLSRAGEVLAWDAIEHPALRARYAIELLFPGARVIRETGGLDWRAAVPLRSRMARAGSVIAEAWNAARSSHGASSTGRREVRPR